jgi:hypothetical protein
MVPTVAQKVAGGAKTGALHLFSLFPMLTIAYQRLIS